MAYKQMLSDFDTITHGKRFVEIYVGDEWDNICGHHKFHFFPLVFTLLYL